MPAKLDLTNQRFNKLLVLKPAPRRNDRYTRWICQCDCGNLCEVRTDYLKSGHTTSCGCEKAKLFTPKDLTNQRFNHLIALKRLNNGKWLCQCDCGNTTEVQTDNLLSGNTQSCGCLQKERTSQATIKDLTGQRFGKLLVLERVKNNKFNHICYKCQCDCGGITIVDAVNLRNGNTTSCGCIKSKGESKINQWLQAHNINCIPQYSVDQIILKSGRHPLFDFAIFDNHNQLLFLLEFNGQQHYQITNGWNNQEQFKITQDRDNQKKEQCNQLNIPLYTIRYDEDIQQRLQEIFNIKE